MYFIYSGRKQSVTAYVSVSDVALILIQEERSHYCYAVYHSMIAILFEQQGFNVFLAILHSSFYHLSGRIIEVTMESFSINSVLLNNCTFAHNSAFSSVISPHTYIISVYYKLCCAKINIKITNCAFLYTNYDNPNSASGNALLHFEVVEKKGCNLPQNDNMLISFSNVKFRYNMITLLQVFSILPIILNDSTIITIIAADTFTVENNNCHNKLILLHNTKFYFTGRSVFTYNVHSDTMYSYSSEYIILEDNATLQIINNDIKLK